MDQLNCQINVIHQDRLGKAQGEMPDAKELATQAELYKMLGDPTRLRLLQALAITEMCVCDLAALVESSVSAVSHQLRLLRSAKLVCSRKEGKMVYYRLSSDRMASLLLAGQKYMAER